MEKRNTARDSNLELFRILTMLLIVAHHYVVNSGLTELIYQVPSSMRALFLLLFGAWGKTGINCFLMITGYFMCKSSISAKKYAKLVLEVLFYRLVLNGIFWITNYNAFTWRGLLTVALPVTGIGLGFTEAYLVFFLCIPFLNILVSNMTQRQHIYLLALLFFMYVLFGTIKQIFHITMNYVSWFAVIYLFASYVRLYPNKYFENVRLWGWLTAAFLGLGALSVVYCLRRGYGNAYYYVSDSNNFLALAISFSAFLFFKNMKMRHSPVINRIAATCFGVLQIHANSDAMRQWLWKDVLQNTTVFPKNWMPVHAVCSVLAVFAVCAAIDCLRIRFLEEPFFKLWDRHWPQAAKKLKILENRIFKEQVNG